MGVLEMDVHDKVVTGVFLCFFPQKIVFPLFWWSGISVVNLRSLMDQYHCLIGPFIRLTFAD